MKPNKVDELLAARIASARKEAGMSAQEVADALCMSAEEFDDIETARVRITPAVVSRLALHFNKPTAWFFDQTPRKVDLFSVLRQRK